MTLGPNVSLEQTLQARLQERKDQSLYRLRMTTKGPQKPLLHVRGRDYLSFTSNDYLGLANHPLLIEAMQNAASEYGVGSGASHLVCGHSAAHDELEQALAKLTGRPKALLFGSGYMANIGIISALLDKSDAVFEDRLNHASLLDGGLLSGARFQRYQHNDVLDLQRRLQKTQARNKLVVTDAVFSMDGDQAPLPQLADVCTQQDAWLMLDDAHGIGVLGLQGGGTALAAGLSVDQAPIYMGTLGKALGCYGAFVAGSETLIDALLQFSRSYIYTTAVPPAVAVAALTAVQLLRQESWRQTHLQQLITAFRAAALDMGLPLMDSYTAIQPLLIGDADKAMKVSQALRDVGILVTAIRPPTVPVNSARLRITLTAAHTQVQVEQLLATLGKLQQSGLLTRAL
ncbi:MAG: 8-amino-7-oxononanoate synthase [Gammaproteobacteria bacterium]|nr:8-amino-7-oxononanoate synthase [Gammaproteobacteria bacterium]